MTYRLLSIFLCLLTTSIGAQIKGTVTSTKGDPLPFVNIFIENTYKGTTSNDDGLYELDYITKNTVTIVFQYLGYKTLKKSITIDALPFTLNITLEEEDISLDEVVVNAEENPANIIIRKTIAERSRTLRKIQAFKADFYSRGLIRIKNAPEKILEQEVGDLGGGLDSTRSGIIYLSETISKLNFKRPDKLKEKIIASKISGDDNGFSFNTASDLDFNFYNNTIELGNQIVSPIADGAFSYYRYKLEGIFYDDNGNLINKIRVTPRRENDRVFSGSIYIVEDQWVIYALELDITGQQAQLPAAEVITLKQNFSFSKKYNLWALISQSIDFKYGLFGIGGDGRFTAVYSNYAFNPTFEERAFTNEILSFEKEANKKDSIYWENSRPVPLTSEEIKDYVRKDSIQIIKESKPYLDSIDKANNHFKIFDLITGYSYQDSHKNYRFNFSGPLRAMSFNTVQGPNARATLSFRKNYNEFKRFLNIETGINYSISDRRLRPTARLTYKFNNISRPYITLSGGNKVQQFNPANPIAITVNSIASLFFEDNYMKLYDKSFLQLDYSHEWFNGFRFFSTFAYEKRQPLVNTSTNLIIDDPGDLYTSNNPLDESLIGVAPIDDHDIYKLNISARINFDQKYMSYPESKFNYFSSKYPVLTLTYEKGFASNKKTYNFDQVRARLTQNINLGNKGLLSYNLRAGKFFNAETITFIDYQHFNGNLTHVGTTANYLNVFNNMPYYKFSTNKEYLEFHAEHDFKGFILGKIPLLNKLNYNLVIGAHALSTPTIKPYQEYTIGIDNLGWGKFRFLRFDYVRSYQNGFAYDGVVFGIKLLNLIN